MKKIITLSLILLYFNAAAQYEAFQALKYTDSKGTVLNYRLLLPPDYNPNNKYPLILFLHGGGERGDDNISQLKYGSEMFLNKSKETPFIGIFPQCAKEDYWASVKFSRAKYPLELDFNYAYPENPSLHAAIELVQSMIKGKKADKKRIFITGMSMGGMGTFEAVYRYPKLFAAAAPICGGADLNAYSKTQAKVPFRIYHGDVDGVIPVKHSREATEKLKALVCDVVYKEYPGVNHNSWDNVFKEPDYLTWLLAQKKK